MAVESPARGSERIPMLDGFRGAAILLVFLYHGVFAAFSQTWLHWAGWLRDFDVPASLLVLLPLCLGWAGVAVFFVVSGFCIRLSQGKSTKRGWSEFAVRRFWRIYPPYLVAVVGFAVVYPETRLLFKSLGHWAQLGSHLLLIHNIDPKSFFGINPSFWSIAVEAQLYLLYPVLCRLAGRFGWKRTLGIVGGIEIAARLMLTVAGDEVPLANMATDVIPAWLAGSPFVYWYSWSIGAWLAEAWLRHERLPFARYPPWLWVSLFMFAYFFRPLVAFSFLFAALATATVLARMLDRSRAGGLARAGGGWLSSVMGRLLAAVGVISYGMYLPHQPLLFSSGPLLRKVSPALAQLPAVVFVTAIALSTAIIAASVVFYRLVERPGIALGKRLFARPPNTALNLPSASL